MDNASYAALTRQVGLMREMQGIANNLANMSTAGFRREGVVFSEYVQELGPGTESLSLSNANGRAITTTQGTLSQTDARLDLAIEGDGYFLIGAPDGEYLTRAGGFSQSDTGEIVTQDGHFLLDSGGAPIPVPLGTRSLAIAADGTMSADGVPVAEIGLWEPTDPLDLSRRTGTAFTAAGGVQPAEGDAAILQGFLESSNVSPVTEITRLIAVQRAYEAGQNFLDKEDERIRSVMRTVTR